MPHPRLFRASSECRSTLPAHRMPSLPAAEIQIPHIYLEKRTQELRCKVTASFFPEPRLENVPDPSVPTSQHAAWPSYSENLPHPLKQEAGLCADARRHRLMPGGSCAVCCCPHTKDRVRIIHAHFAQVLFHCSCRDETIRLCPQARYENGTHLCGRSISDR